MKVVRSNPSSPLAFCLSGLFISELFACEPPTPVLGTSLIDFRQPPTPTCARSLPHSLYSRTSRLDFLLLGGEGSSRGHTLEKLAHRDTSHVLSDLARRTQAVALGPRACDGATQVTSTCGDVHLADSRPHGPGRARFGCNHGRQIIRALAVNRLTRMNTTLSTHAARRHPNSSKGFCSLPMARR